MLKVNQLIGFGAGGGGISPSDLSGLQHWYRSDLGITKDGSDKVSNWADQVAGGTDLGQGTGIQQPLWRASQLNGQPDVYFDGSDFMAASFGAISQPHHHFWVIKAVTWTSDDYIWSADTTSNLRQSTATPDVYQSDGTVLVNPVSLTLGTWFLLESLFNGASSYQCRNADSNSSGGNAGTGVAQNLRPGSNSAGSNQSDFAVAEIAIYNRALAAAEIASLKSYFRDRYALY